MLKKEILKRVKPCRSVSDLEALVNRVKDSRVVMLGEASHGTHEYYKWREAISKELIEKHGFQFIAVEGDWPPCHAVNNYVKNKSKLDLDSVTRGFERWPTWMWANQEIVELIDWLKKFNTNRTEKKIGFHGLDVYSLFESIEEVLKKLQTYNPKLAEYAKKRYKCFDPYYKDEKKYIRAIARFKNTCECEVIETLKMLLDYRLKHKEDEEVLFDVVQNAKIVLNAEYYYRAMIFADEITWNIRDQHMMDTLDYLLNFYGPDSKGIIWEHNTHIGDYRATDMESQGQVNIGGLARIKYGEENVSLVGFGSYEGSVIASYEWGGQILKLPVPPARSDSYEAALHEVSKEVGAENYYLVMDEEAKKSALAERRGHRAIGVVYNPKHEKWGNYVPTSLAQRYDVFMYFDKTEALKPILLKPEPSEVPETYPSGV